MAIVTIRDLENGVVRRLKSKAKARGRSLEAELRELLRHEARRPTGREARRLVDRIAAMTPKGVRQTESVELLREDRDR